MKSKIAVVGLGNILLRDEGVGVHVVQYLQHSYSFRPMIDFVDGGTAGLQLIPYFENNDKIIIADAIDFGKQPGFIGSFKNDEILHLFKEKISLHHLGLSDLLSDLKLHDKYPQAIYLVGVQPALTDLGLELSEVVQSKMAELCNVITRQLSTWHVRFKKNSENEFTTSFMKT